MLQKVKKRWQWILDGTWPRWWAIFSLKLWNLRPKTFNEKIRHRMAFDRTPLLRIFSDKYAVREYVANQVGEIYLSRIYAVTDSLETVTRTELPREFVVKATHGSGGCVIVSESAPTNNELPRSAGLGNMDWSRYYVHPDALDWGRLVALSADWMRQRWDWIPGKPYEWAYGKVPARVIVEEKYAGAETDLPRDYKLYMFRGRCAAIRVSSEWYQDFRLTWFTPDWSKLSVSSIDAPPSDMPLPRPPQLDEMLRIASALSLDIDFVRVDLFATTQGVKFGELTCYPTCGRGTLTPQSFDFELGKSWT